MRIVVQKVHKAGVTVNENRISDIKQGYLIFVGVDQDDDQTDCEYLAKKIIGLRIFEDLNGKMNRSIKEVNGEILMVSQFTLCGDVRKGNRPNFTRAKSPQQANELFEYLVQLIDQENIKIQKGCFGAHMMVDLVNDGPVTILLDSKRTF